MSYFYQEVSEAFTFRTKTAGLGAFCLEKSVRDRVYLRWNKRFPGHIGFVLLDNNGEELYRRSRPISRNFMVGTTKELQKYLGVYQAIEVTIIHFLDGRNDDMHLQVRLLSSPGKPTGVQKPQRGLVSTPVIVEHSVYSEEQRIAYRPASYDLLSSSPGPLTTL